MGTMGMAFHQNSYQIAEQKKHSSKWIDLPNETVKACFQNQRQHFKQLARKETVLESSNTSVQSHELSVYGNFQLPLKSISIAVPAQGYLSETSLALQETPVFTQQQIMSNFAITKDQVHESSIDTKSLSNVDEQNNLDALLRYIHEQKPTILFEPLPITALPADRILEKCEHTPSILPIPPLLPFMPLPSSFKSQLKSYNDSYRCDVTVEGSFPSVEVLPGFMESLNSRNFLYPLTEESASPPFCTSYQNDRNYNMANAFCQNSNCSTVWMVEESTYVNSEANKGHSDSNVISQERVSSSRVDNTEQQYIPVSFINLDIHIPTIYDSSITGSLYDYSSTRSDLCILKNTYSTFCSVLPIAGHKSHIARSSNCKARQQMQTSVTLDDFCSLSNDIHLKTFNQLHATEPSIFDKALNCEANFPSRHDEEIRINSLIPGQQLDDYGTISACVPVTSLCTKDAPLDFTNNFAYCASSSATSVQSPRFHDCSFYTVDGASASKKLHRETEPFNAEHKTILDLSMIGKEPQEVLCQNENSWQVYGHQDFWPLVTSRQDTSADSAYADPNNNNIQCNYSLCNNLDEEQLSFSTSVINFSDHVCQETENFEIQNSTFHSASERNRNGVIDYVSQCHQCPLASLDEHCDYTTSLVECGQHPTGSCEYTSVTSLQDNLKQGISHNGLTNNAEIQLYCNEDPTLPEFSMLRACLNGTFAQAEYEHRSELPGYFKEFFYNE